MSGILAQMGEADILAVYFQGAPAPSGFQILLCNDDVQFGDYLGDIVGEPIGNGYRRPSLAPNTTGWPILVLNGSSYMVTCEAVTFSAVGGTWGPVTTAVLALQGIAVPTGLTVTPQGATGAATATYVVTALSAYGETIGCTAVQISNANAVFNGTNYPALVWNTVSGAVSYKVYRIQTTASPVSTGLIATVSNTTYDDEGAIGNGASPPLTDSSGKLICAYPLASALTLNDGESEDINISFSFASQLS